MTASLLGIWRIASFKRQLFPSLRGRFSKQGEAANPPTGMSHQAKPAAVRALLPEPDGIIARTKAEIAPLVADSRERFSELQGCLAERGGIRDFGSCDFLPAQSITVTY